MTEHLGRRQRLVYLLRARSRAERSMLDRWIATTHPVAEGPPQVVVLDRGAATEAALAEHLVDRDHDVVLQPMGVAWQPRQRNGRRDSKLRDVVAEGDPRAPRPLQHGWLLRADPHRAQVTIGEPATVADLAERFDAPGDAVRPGAAGPPSDGFAGYVARRALLALEREDVRVHGPQYKIPRLVREEIFALPRFRAGLADLAEREGRPLAEVLVEARACLAEMVAGYGRARLDVSMALGRSIRRQGYDPDLDLDLDAARDVAERARTTSSVVLPTHRSNFDASVMPTAWHQLGLPPTHTLAGINMAFWPMGAIMRRAGAIFIRRETTGDPVYRYALREYIGYLVEKRFPLEWYIEGGRSRTGKLLPPKMGALKYVLDAYREGRTDDVLFIPASMTYDQLREVADYAALARGQAKPAEGLAWALGYWRRQPRRYGRIYVRFGEPVSLRAAIGPPGRLAMADEGLALQKVAFEVATRINGVTPITAAALVTLALLGGMGRALTFDQVLTVVRAAYADAERRGLPMTSSARALTTDDGVRAALDALVANDVVVRWEGGPDVVYAIGPDQHLAAAYYRNSIVHHFLGDSIAQLALHAAAQPDGAGDARERFWSTAMDVRDLLKFEFFFFDKAAFRQHLAARVADHVADWEARLADGPRGAAEVLAACQPVVAHLTLRSFVEAYFVVATELARRDDAPAEDRKAVLRACTGLGRQLLLQRRIHSPESVSKPLFETGLQLATHLGLIESGADVATARAELVERLRTVLDHLDALAGRAGGTLAELLDSTR